MAFVVLGVWLVQSAAGAALVLRSRRASVPLTHVTCAVVGLALWTGFLATGMVLWAWAALVALTVGNALGDRMLVQRHRRASGTTGFWRDYGGAIGDTVRGRVPPLVIFHAWFAGVVYFLCLGVALAATLSG
jgi:hypothetical protein